ncbi:MAG TPA: glycerol-3-phosphate acyltransferase, partial [Leptospiraceae bacterium]|nr:glycerol-3-phosphate acyltransferase [Leptospiraceae bacterium]
MENSVFVLGSGPLGLILSSNLSEKASSVTLCWHDSAEAARMRRDGGTRLLNQDFFFPDNVEIADRTAYLPDDCILIVAISSRELEETMEAMLASFKDRSGLIVLFTKGLPSYTARKKYNARTFCEYMEKFSHDRGIHQLKFAAVNGPSLLSELYHGSYSFLNVGCADTDAGKRIAELLSNDRIQCGYTSDTIGVEMGGVLKNPIAIASGIATNLAECGGNFAGELIQHGFQEMLSLSLAIGARQETLIGRSGIADLMTTCLSKESRNRAYGEDFIKRLQSGSEEHGVMDRIETFLNPARVIQKDAAQGQDVVEGAYAIASIVEIAAELKVEVPLYNALYEILSRRSPPNALISAITGAPVRASEPQVLHRRQGLHLAAGTDFVEVLSSRVFHSVQVTKGMQSRIKKQATQVLTQLDKRLQKAKKVKNRMDLQKIPHERDLWLSFSSSIGESESRALRHLIQFYAEEIADSYTPGMRETLIRLLAPVRFAASGFKLGSAMPKIGGNTEELKNLAAHYNVMYTPTHRSHLDSVEVAFGLS